MSKHTLNTIHRPSSHTDNTPPPLRINTIRKPQAVTAPTAPTAPKPVKAVKAVPVAAPVAAPVAESATNYIPFLCPQDKVVYYKDDNGFLHEMNPNKSIGAYVGYWDGRTRTIDRSVPSPDGEKAYWCSVPNCEECNTESVIRRYINPSTGKECDFCVYHAIEYARAQSLGWDSLTVVSHNICEDALAYNLECEECNVKLNEDDMNKFIMADTDSALCEGCVNAKSVPPLGAAVPDSQGSADDDEGMLQFEELMVKEQIYFKKVGTQTLYLNDLTSA